MKKRICLFLCALSWTAWARPDTNLEELRAIDRRGQTWKSSVTPPSDNRRWLADLTPEQFKPEDLSLLKGTWSTGPRTGAAVLKLPSQWGDHILSLEITGTADRGSLRLEGGGQELLTLANPGPGEMRLSQKVNLSLSQAGELRWFLTPKTVFRLHRIRVYQLK